MGMVVPITLIPLRSRMDESTIMRNDKWK